MEAMEANVREIVFDEYMRKIKDGEVFQQANYGDGEWQVILGWVGKGNSDKITYTQHMTDVLKDTLVDGHFTHYGTNCGQKILNAVKVHIIENKLQELDWVYKETLTNANCNGYIGWFFKEMKRREVVIIGGEHLSNLDIIPNAKFIPVPRYDAFETYIETGQKILKHIDRKPILLFSAGFMTNATMHYLLKCYPETRNLFMIDMGAIFDPYVGVWSRSKYKKEEWQKTTLLKNIEDSK